MSPSSTSQNLTIRKSTVDIALLVLLACVPIFVLMVSFILGKNASDYFVWWLTLFAFGAAAFPFTALLFRNFRSKGYGFSKAIGILFASFFIWTFTYLRVLTFSRFWVFASLFILAVICWGFPQTRKEALKTFSSKSDVYEIAWSEALFAIILLILCFIKGVSPEINGEEKFMDFAFLNSLIRTEMLPAPDPWLAGQSINYYYFGQYIYAFLAKFSGIKPGIAYVLSMCTSIAIAFSMAYSIGAMVIEGAIRKGLKAPHSARLFAGLLSAFAVCIMGNSHSFFYDEKGIGNKFLNFLSAIGVKTGRIDGFFYPDSTRFIGHNPDVKIIDDLGKLIHSGDYTIHEFPFYSFLIGDLHAHVVSMMVVLLIIAVFFLFVFRAEPPDAGEKQIGTFFSMDSAMNFGSSIRAELKRLLSPEILIVAVLLSICTMCNYWDFLIYFVFSAMVLLIYNSISSRHFFSLAGTPLFLAQIGAILYIYLKYSSMPGNHVFLQTLVFGICLIGATIAPSALTRTGLGMSFLFTSASLLSLPFQSQFEMISNAIGLVKNHTSLYQFIILWSVHILLAFSLIVLTILSRAPLPEKKAKVALEYDPLSYSNAVSRFFGMKNRADIFMCGTAIVGFLMLLAPELIYVRDIYEGDYSRANTMFKFAFAAFILLSIVLGYTVFRFLYHRDRFGDRLMPAICFFIVFALLLFIPAHYPGVALEQRSGKIIRIAAYKGLDGTEALLTRDSVLLPEQGPDLLSYAMAIDYLNANVSGTPVICEVYGDSYTDHCVVSAYTGLPTIFGWQTHEWLWRFQGIENEEGKIVQNPDKPDLWKDIIIPRHDAVDNIYISLDEEITRHYLDMYDVTYLIVGELERTHYGYLDDSFLQSLGQVVFSTDDLYIVKVQ